MLDPPHLSLLRLALGCAEDITSSGSRKSRFEVLRGETSLLIDDVQDGHTFYGDARLVDHKLHVFYNIGDNLEAVRYYLHVLIVSVNYCFFPSSVDRVNVVFKGQVGIGVFAGVVRKPDRRLFFLVGGETDGTLKVVFCYILVIKLLTN